MIFKKLVNIYLNTCLEPLRRQYAKVSSRAESRVRFFESDNVSEIDPVSITSVLIDWTSTLSGIYSSTTSGLVKGREPIGGLLAFLTFQIYVK
jgi:hypothetical protein